MPASFDLEGGFDTNMRKRSLDVGIAQAGETLASRAAGVDRRQAFLDVVAMLLDMPRDEEFHGCPVIDD